MDFYSVVLLPGPMIPSLDLWNACCSLRRHPRRCGLENSLQGRRGFSVSLEGLPYCIWFGITRPIIGVGMATVKATTRAQAAKVAERQNEVEGSFVDGRNENFATRKLDTFWVGRLGVA